MSRFRTFSPTLSARPQSDWKTLAVFLPYIWVYKWRVSFAMLFLILAKVAGMGVPVILKELIDGLSAGLATPQALLVLPVGLLLAYGALRLAGTLFTELRELLFVRMILKDPAILIFDEATSALDTHAEQVIQAQLREY